MVTSSPIPRTSDLLYLARADIAAIEIGLLEVEAAVEAAFRAKARGQATALPKIGFRPTPQSAHFFAMPGALPDLGVAALKWVALADNNRSRAVPSISGLIVVSDLTSGLPLAVMDGVWVTEVRTAAATTVAARALAKPDARRIGFVACGQQARSHLAALRLRLPLEEVVAYSRQRASAEAFAREASTLGLAARVAAEPREAVLGMDIVVTSVPPQPGPHRFLDPDWLAPGSFASLVDIGRSWQAAGFERIDRVITDDCGQSEAVAVATDLPYRGPFHAELGEILEGSAPARRGSSERLMFLHAGIALTDVAVAALIGERALALGRGTRLPL